MKRCFAYIAIATCSVLFSCNKAEKNNIVGTWNVKETAGDENGNKALDASERKTIGDPIISYQYTFKSDGTVSVDLIDKVCGTITEGKWKLKNGGKELEIVMDNTTTQYDIQTLTNKELKTQSDHQTGYRSWMTMEKQ